MSVLTYWWRNPALGKRQVCSNTGKWSKQRVCSNAGCHPATRNATVRISVETARNAQGLLMMSCYGLHTCRNHRSPAVCSHMCRVHQQSADQPQRGFALHPQVIYNIQYRCVDMGFYMIHKKLSLVSRTLPLK